MDNGFAEAGDNHIGGSMEGLTAIAPEGKFDPGNGFYLINDQQEWYLQQNYATGNLVYKRNGDEWELYRDEGALQNAYSRNLSDAADFTGKTYALLIAGAMTGFSTTTLGESSLSAGRLTVNNNQYIGRLIGWGEGQATVQQTINVTRTLTSNQIRSWINHGLTKRWVQRQLASYTKNISKAAKNTQMIPRKELMDKIIELWPY